MKPISSRRVAPSRAAHPFYCNKKQCRKTAKDTPEYLSDADWTLLRGLVAALEARDLAAFDRLLDDRAGDRRSAQAFFYRICGWPEGLRYYMEGSDRVRQGWFDNFIARDLSGWQQAILDRSPLGISA